MLTKGSPKLTATWEKTGRSKQPEGTRRRIQPEGEIKQEDASTPRELPRGGRRDQRT